MYDSFGDRLRRQRESRGVDLVAIAEQTKIKLSLLEDLERDDVSHWPSGIFRRAFIRAYAHAIGLDEAQTVREFLDRHPEPCEPVFVPAVTSGDEAEQANAGPHIRLRAFVGSAFGSLSRRRRTPPVDNGVTPAVPEPSLVPEPLVLEPLPVPDPQSVSAPQPVSAPRPMLAPQPVPEPEPEPMLEPVAEMAAADDPGAAPAEPTAADPAPVSLPAAAEPDLMDLADLCTQFGRVDDALGVLRLLERAAGLLDATGLIVWVWDPSVAALKPALAHGYPERIVLQLPLVHRSENNATAAAFRSAQICAIDGNGRASGAIAVPLITPVGCAGVLAIELPDGREQARGVRAVATILAAMLAQLVDVAEPIEARGEAPCA